ncbi:MAG: hypothetical protein JXA36_03715 [Coriobacteriia bacterium]|nr:hypothetical protein [Coriobacteriia bacterium]
MASRTAPGGGWLHRLAPARLSTRLTASIVITTGFVFVVTATVVGLGLSSYTRSLTAADSQRQLTEVRYVLGLQADALDALVVGFTEWREFYDRTVSPSEEFVYAEFDPWLAERAAADTVVWADGRGTVINSFGDAEDISALLKLADENPGGMLGPFSLPSGPAVVALRPVVGDPPATSVGTLAVARSVTTEELAACGVQDVTVTLRNTSADDDGKWRDAAHPEGFSSVMTRLRDGNLLTRATMTGVDGNPALSLEITRPDPWLGDGRAPFVFLVPLVLGLVTLGVGYLLGVVLSRTVGRPLRKFITYLQEQGYLALQGLRTDEELLVDPTLPDDFADLAQVIKDLMTQLRINQSELIEAGEQALSAERAFRTVVEESPEVKILVRGGVVEIANPAAAHFLGLQLGDLLRAEPEGLFSGVTLLAEDGTPLKLPDIAAKRQEAPVVARVVAPDQSDRWIELSVASIDPAGHDYVISARNITEERRLEALREEVLSLVSHDLRSPLTVVRGYLDILGKPLDEERRTSAIEGAQRAAQRMEDLLDDLLHATRAERVFAPKVLRPVDLGALVEGVATSLRLSAEQQIFTATEPDITVLGDVVRLEQAITNLVGNAIKHGPPEGKVRVEVTARDGRAIIGVEDDGPGIPEDQRKTLFARGARGEASAGTPGMGLGLYIVRVVAEAHGGSAYVDDMKNGTRFVLDLPIVEPDAESF